MCLLVSADCLFRMLEYLSGQLFDLIGRFSMEKCQFDAAYTIFQFLSDVLKESVISP